MNNISATPKNVALFALKLLVTGALLAVCFSRVEIIDLIGTITDANPAMLGVAFAFAVLGTIVIPAVVTKYALALERIDLSLRDLIAINFSLRLYVIVLPRVISLGVRWARYGKGKLSSDALALLGFERAVYLTTMFGCSLVAVTFELSMLGKWAGPIWTTTLAGLAIALVALSPFVYGPSVRTLRAVSGWCEMKLPDLLAAKLSNLTEAVTAFRSLRKKSNLAIFCASAAGVFFFVLSAYVVAESLRIEIGFVALIWVRTLVFALTLAPISVGGVGLREVGFVGLLGIYGVPASEALAFSLANFALQLTIAAVGAILEAYRVTQRLGQHVRTASRVEGKN